MVRLRLKRFGRTHGAFYRLNAIDKRSPRNGRVIEELGWYDPIAKDPDKQLKLNAERIDYWLSVGAQPSRTAANLIKKIGLDPTPGKNSRPSAVTNNKERMNEPTRLNTKEPLNESYANRHPHDLS